MVTTIQLKENVKCQLDKLKTSDKDTYEDVILNLITYTEKCARENEELLIEGCKVMAKDSLEIAREWDSIESKHDWEW